MQSSSSTLGHCCNVLWDQKLDIHTCWKTLHTNNIYDTIIFRRIAPLCLPKWTLNRLNLNITFSKWRTQNFQPISKCSHDWQIPWVATVLWDHTDYSFCSHVAQELGPLDPCERLELNPWLLVWAWISPIHYNHLRSEPTDGRHRSLSLPLSMSLFLWNKYTDH